MTPYPPRRLRPLLLALALSASVVPATVLAAPDGLAAIVAAPRLDMAAIAHLYAQAVLANGLPALHAQLDAMTGAGPARGRAMALLVKAGLRWQAGDRMAALAATDAALALAPGYDALLLRAELLDTVGRTSAATEAYRRALAAAPDAAARDRIGLRLAMNAAMRRPEALAAYARTQPPAIAAHIAPMLALLGQPKAALAFAPRGGIADDLRVAEWAIAAGDTATARQRAWHAASTATDAGDRRYALAMLVEAYSAAGDVKGAAAFLQGKPQTAEVAQARLDLTLELGHPDEAIALIERSTDPAVRRRLTGVLDLAGRGAASEAEYRRLIASDPHQPQWYGALAALYLARGDEAQARSVYAGLFAANRGRAEVLTAGARQMVAMGLQDQAVAMLERSGGDPAAATATHLFLFETWLDAGDTAAAARELAALRAGARAPALLIDVADGYERLGQPAEALALLTGVEAGGVALGYDQQVRIAELSEKVGRKDDALTRWRTLLATTTLPARRSYIERQIVRLAKQTGRLASFTAEIGARLDAGTLRPGEIDLLVALRLAQDDRAGAVAAGRRDAARTGASEVVTLRRLATLYARMRDQDELDRVLRRLIAIDPVQRDQHVRQYILSSLRAAGDGAAPEQRRAELDRLMAQLGDARGASAYQFRATVYGMAALDDQAIVQLRAGLAAKPRDLDALLQLAAALKKQGHRDQAVALLQFVAEHGDPAAFATAIDGLIDQLADAPSTDGGTDAALEWTTRAVLERMVSTGSDARLQALLGDLANVRGEHELQLRSLEASLPEAADQRGSVLRQLVTISSGSTGDDGGGPSVGDPQRKIVYGRRLLALGRSYPPDFYADLGRTMLAHGDGAGAERAFAMMGDLGGLVNVDALKGDAYAAQDRADAALANYARALLRDQNDLDLGVKTAVLRERFGQYDLAQRWYWRALRTLLARQPMAASGNGDGALDVRRYLPTLTEGLLLTWPTDPARGAAMRADLAQMFADAVAQVDPAHPGRYAARPRLALVVELGHRIADAVGDDGMAAGWDATLDRLFAGDAAYLRGAALRRGLTGAAPAAAGTDWPMAALGVQARDDANDNLLVALALATSDMATLGQLTAASLADEQAWRGALTRGEQPAGRPPTFVTLLLDLMERLPADRFRAVILAPLQVSPIRDELAFDLFRAFPDRYDRLEAIAGKPLLTPAALVEMTVTRGNTALGFSVRSVRRRVSSDAWMERFSPDQLIALYDGLVTRMVQGGGDSSLAEILLGRLLAQPLDPARQARLAASMERDIGFLRDPRVRSVGPLLPRLLQLDTPPANRPLLAAQASATAQRYRDARQLPAFLEAWFAGDKARAFQLLLTLSQEVSATYTDSGWYDRIVPRYFPEARRGEVDAFLADGRPDADRTARFYNRFLLGDDTLTGADRLRYYRKLVAVAPGNTIYLTGLLGLLAEQNDWAGFEPPMRAYVDGHPDDREAATMLVVVERLLDRPAQATAVASAADVDPSDAAWMTRLYNRAAAARSTSAGGLIGLFAPLYDAYRDRFPQDAAMVAIEARRGPSITRVEEPGARSLVEAAGRDPASVPGVLRGLWRNTAAVPGEGDPDDARAALATALVAASTTDAGKAGSPSAAVLRGDVVAEIEHYLSVSAPTARARRLDLYDVVARGLIATGLGAARLPAMLATLREGRHGAHALYLLAALLDQTETPLAAADRALFVARLQAMPALSLDGRLTMARVLARSGDLPASAGLLRAALTQFLYPLTPLDQVDDQQAAVRRLVAVLRLWPDRAASDAVYAGLSAIVEDKKRGVGPTVLERLPPIAEAAAQGIPAPAG